MMKKHLTKFVLALLVLAMVLGCASLLASCSGKGGDKKEEGDGTADEKDVLAKLPQKSFASGSTKDEFMILCRDEGEEFYREDSGTDNIDKEIYMRNMKVENTYGVKLAYKSYQYYDLPDMVSTLIKSDDQNSMDVISNHIVYSSNIVTAGNALNWQEIPYIDLTEEWWAKSNLDDLTIDGQTYIIMGDMQTTAIALTYCFYYNKDLADTFSIGDMREIVMNKEWTYEKLLELTKKAGRVDLDKNGKYNDKDGYGFLAAGGSSVNAFLWAFDNPIFEKDAQGEQQFTFMSKKVTTILNKLVTLYNKEESVFYTYAVADQATRFVNGQGLFFNAYFGMAMKELRDMNTDSWGIIPYPAWNASQLKSTGYLTSVDGGHNSLIAPYFRNASASKTEELGIVIEALAALSHEGLRVAYYDKALKAQYVGDPKEAAMIDMLMECRVFDFGYIYLAFNSPAFWFQNMVPARNTNIASQYASQKSALNTAITAAFASFGVDFEGLE